MFQGVVMIIQVMVEYYLLDFENELGATYQEILGELPTTRNVTVQQYQVIIQRKNFIAYCNPVERANLM